MTRLTAGILGGLVNSQAFCLACQRPPREVSRVDTHEETVLRFYCHGATEDVAIPMGVYVGDDSSLGAFVDRLPRLFVGHGHPDVRELIQYNNEPWRLT